MMGRCLAGLAVALLLQPLAAHATTANSLSGRVVIDGVLNEYAADEWVLDSTANTIESASDSPWGSDNDIARVALTWDRTYLYIGVEARTFDSFLALFVSNRAGGLTTLENAGAFRRAIEIPNPVNLVALAEPGRIPDVARADDAHPFGLVDRGAVHVAINGVRTGLIGFEMAVPWSMLAIAQPVKLVAAITGEVGTGAGDAAPDASTAQDSDRFVRAVLDRWFEINADVDHDGLPDIGISPRTTGSVLPPVSSLPRRDEAVVHFRVPTRAFAPDRAEWQNVVFVADGARVFVNFYAYSLEGERIRWLNRDMPDLQMPGGSEVAVPWDGTDEHGAIVRGGTYIIVADWGYNRGEHAGRA
ncbi:MAG TPA: hypothetical protein VJS69_15190, partial [Candidatus Krumholzibacteria bacterium]|nr:hypothetical protein [Candidatus Krumholzibacteria bacterium]